MRTRLVALAATLGIAGLAAASLALATVPSGGGSAPAGGGGMHGGGGGGGAHGGGGYAHGGGGYAGGHFGGGRFEAGGYRGGGFRGGGGSYGGSAGYAAHASFMAHGGYVSHGGSGYRVVGYQSAGPAHGTGLQGDRGGRVALALGPRMGSAAAAARLDGTARVERTGRLERTASFERTGRVERTDRLDRADRMHPRPGHPGRPGPPEAAQVLRSHYDLPLRVPAFPAATLRLYGVPSREELSLGLPDTGQAQSRRGQLNSRISMPCDIEASVQDG